MIDLTVILATHNGSGVLPRTLEAYGRIGRGDRRWKMIVVDNASTDATASILGAFRSRLPLTIIREPQPGKNRALNRALEHIEGQCIVFTDDDAVPEAGFLDAWREALGSNPGYALFGGTIEPQFEEPPPDWHLHTQAHFDVLYAANRRSDGPIDSAFVFGPNMAVRADVLRAGLRFPEDVGPNARDRNYPMGSETAFCRLAANAGHKAWFASAPRVRHIVRPHQVTQTYISARARRFGRGVAVQQWESGSLVPRTRRTSVVFALGIAVRRLRQARLYLRTLAGAPAARFEALWQFEVQLGFDNEYEMRRRAFRSGHAVTGN